MVKEFFLHLVYIQLYIHSSLNLSPKYSGLLSTSHKHTAFVLDDGACHLPSFIRIIGIDTRDYGGVNIDDIYDEGLRIMLLML